MDFFTFRPGRENVHVSGEKTPKFAFVPTYYVFIYKKGVKYCPGKRVPKEKNKLSFFLVKSTMNAYMMASLA